MPTSAANAKVPESDAIPTELTDLAGNWSALPDHIRKASRSLATL